MLRILAFLLAFPTLVLAQDLPLPLSDTVSDFADLLTPVQETALTTRLKAARSQTGVQIAVVTMERIADFGSKGQSIETYAKNLFNAWGVGGRARNDGILMLIAKDDRAMRIALGDGYDPVYDGLGQRVMDRDMLPLFRADDYAGGIAKGVETVITTMAQPFAAHATPVNVETGSDQSESGLGSALIFGGAVVAMILLSLRRVFADAAVRFKRCPNCGARSLSRERHILTPATSTTAGSGVQTTRCAQCAYKEDNSYATPIIKSGSSGNDGFGGGHSSGGGATGRW